MRVGSRHWVDGDNIKTPNGNVLVCVKELRYLGVYLVSSSKFKCNFSYAKKAFYRSFNAIFGRVGRLATEEVVLHLIVIVQRLTWRICCVAKFAPYKCH